jgi:hypothetical protein
MTMKKKYTRFEVTLELDSTDYETPAMVYYRSGSATYGFAIDTGIVCGNEDINLPKEALLWLAGFEEQVDEIYNLARADD